MKEGGREERKEEREESEIPRRAPDVCWVRSISDGRIMNELIGDSKRL